MHLGGHTQDSVIRKSLVRMAAICACLVLAAGPVTASPTFALVHSGAQPTSTSSKLGWTSSNWSGYVLTSARYTRITGTWVVPSVTASATSTFSSMWVGIDGYRNSALIQVGTEQDYYGGAAHYSAWWEILPATGSDITSMTVRAGDRMSASIVRNPSGGTWTIRLTDLTSHTSFSTTRRYSGPGSSAEWIQEAPTVGGRTATMARYAATSFSGTVNGHAPHFVAANGGVMVQHGVRVSTPSLPLTHGNAFSITSSPKY